MYHRLIPMEDRFGLTAGEAGADGGADIDTAETKADSGERQVRRYIHTHALSPAQRSYTRAHMFRGRCMRQSLRQAFANSPA